MTKKNKQKGTKNQKENSFCAQQISDQPKISIIYREDSSDLTDAHADINLCWNEGRASTDRLRYK